ncbi:hypothetical protein BC938DRAFT_473854 [Jimgerdemannia flammicorona]|uniref:Uncharacterized protein n=1 Tax=Jimgerdemannia flammicorona TaxID=994334 RepID=A0A433Q377_9FUNG|nr:hypothetical protein BC938DRAFT_473854 [Jimgerdemannia flammicorona]
MIDLWLLTRKSSGVEVRHLHFLRPSAISLKKASGFTAELLEEDDPELTSNDLTDITTTPIIAPSNVSEPFLALYNDLLARTTPTRKAHEYPARSRLKDLLDLVTTAEEVRLLPPLVAQWRLKQFPLTDTTAALVSCACTAGAPDVAFELLGDRAKYALLPQPQDLRALVRAFCARAMAVGDNAGAAMEELDKAFMAFGLAPYYKVDVGEDWVSYGTLIATSARGGFGEEGWRRATGTAKEMVQGMIGKTVKLGDGAKEALLDAANALVAGYEERGEEGDAKRYRALRMVLQDADETMNVNRG